MSALNGTWKLVYLDNFEDYLDTIGVVGEFRERALQLLTPDTDVRQEISIKDNKVNIRTATSVKTVSVEAMIGQSFESAYLDGRPITTVFTMEGDKLTETISKPFTSVITRFIDGENMVMEMRAGDVLSTRKYVKV